jgi:glycine/D-amino acid oxidase-like deaminating enzyme
MTLHDHQIGQSLWSATARPETGVIGVHGALVAEVAIVGGGLVGMSTALHLAQSGVDVIVLDAGQDDGRSCATLASGGLVAPQFIRGNPQSLIAEFGQEEGGRFVRLVAEAGSYSFDLIRSHGLDCGASQNGFIAPFTKAQRAGAEQVVKAWTGWRADTELVDALTAARLTGCSGYDGAVLDRSGGSVNPLGFAREMGRRAAELGARIHRRARVLTITESAGKRLLQLADGSVLANTVILAANGGNMALAPQLRRTVLPMVVREVATEPLPAELRQTILPQDHAMTDRGPDIFTIRFDEKGRLVTAATMPWGRTPAALTLAVNARLRRRIPGWRDARLDYVWSGTAWLNADLQPRYVRIDEATIAVQACNGRGVALAAPIGRNLADWARDRMAPLLLPVTVARPIAAYALARRLPDLALVLAAIRGWAPA